MSDLYRINRKATDADIIRMNSVGLSLATIGDALGVHPTTVTQRLASLNIPPADTRRAFMEDVFRGLEPETREWFADQLVDGFPVKDYIRNLIILKHKQFLESNHANQG